MKRILTIALAFALVGGAAADAKPGDRGHGRGDYERPRGDDGRWQGRGDGRWEAPRNRGRWERGERVPGAYRGGVVDYRSQRLRRPPRGYEWVRVGGDYLLMDMGSGLVLEVIPGR